MHLQALIGSAERLHAGQKRLVLDPSANMEEDWYCWERRTEEVGGQDLADIIAEVAKRGVCASQMQKLVEILKQNGTQTDSRPEETHSQQSAKTFLSHVEEAW